MDFYAPNTENEVVYIEFIEKTINAQLPDHLNDLQLFNLVKTYQADATSKKCWKHNKNECRFSYGLHFTEKTIIAKPLDSKFSNNEKEVIVTWRNALLQQVKSYIDNNLNPAKVNVIDPIKDNFSSATQFQRDSRYIRNF